MRGVVYDFAPSRAGEHARAFLKGWRGKLVCDDYSGYKAGFGTGVIELGCMAHVRRKFFDLHASSNVSLRHSIAIPDVHGAKSRPDRWPMPCMPGWSGNDKTSRKARPLRGRWTMASSVGWR